MEARYSEEEILARQRRNKRSGRSQVRRQQWLEEQDVEWGARWRYALWRWEKQQTQQAWEAWILQEQTRIRVVQQMQRIRMMDEVRRWKADDRWLRSLWQKAGEDAAWRIKDEQQEEDPKASTEKECEPALGSLEKECEPALGSLWDNYVLC